VLVSQHRIAPRAGDLVLDSRRDPPQGRAGFLAERVTPQANLLCSVREELTQDLRFGPPISVSIHTGSLDHPH